jgi:hypothetical protein
MHEQIEAKKKAVKQLTKANKLATGKQPIATNDPLLAIQDVEAAKTRAAHRTDPRDINADQWAT